MFSPPQNTSGGPAMATRSRRRQRQPSGDTTLSQQPKPKRSRGPLTESALTTPDIQNAQIVQPEMSEVKNNKIAKLPKPDDLENAPPTQRVLRNQVPVRSKKPKQGERTSKSDGSIELTKTNAYTVSKLQALPDRVRADSAARQHGVLDASNGYALCVTHTHAFVWPYASTTPSPETFTFALPYPSKHASDPLPLGALVSPGSSTEEPGLVVVMPVSGKVSFWEHISSAATLDYFRQQKTGVEETVSGMWTGEQVVQVARSDSASFILSFSSGRVAHLSVRDSQGKPAISVQFLRTTRGPNSSVLDSFLGGLRTALKSAVQANDIAAVRIESFNKGALKNVVAATKSGRLNAWRVQRGGHNELISSIDARESILKGLQHDLPPITASIDFELVDFTFVPQGIEQQHKEASRLSEALFKDEQSSQHLLLLVSLSDKRQSQFALIELVVEGDKFNVGMVRTITSYTTPVNPSATDRPRLYVPRPALVAFLVFDRAVVLASLAAPPQTPDSQLQAENHVMPATFEDVIDLRSDDSLEIVGTGLEEPLGPGQESEGSRSHRPKARSPTALLMIRGIGVVKIALSEVERFATERPPRVTAKSKLEQAVFYGLKDDNPLVFEGRRSMPFSHEAIANAALELSEDILSSRSSFLSSAPAATENNLRQRSAWLDKLISHLATQKIELNRVVRWELLCNAEKLHMAREVWKLHERFLSERPEHEKKTIISEAVECINEEEKMVGNRSAGEIDRTRIWFLNDSYRLEMLLPWIFQVIKAMRKSKLASDSNMTRFLHESAHVFHATLSGALEYRQNNLVAYGLGDEHVEYGILIRPEDYASLPRFWTSTTLQCEYFYRLIEVCQAWLGKRYQTDEGGDCDPALLESLRDLMPSLVEQVILTLNESVRWSEGTGDDEAGEDGTLYSEKCRDLLETTTALVLKLKDFGLWDGALGIAEKFRDNKALADLVVARLVDLSNQLKIAAPDTVKQLTAEVEAQKKQLLDCMGQHGAGFAYEAYSTLLVYGGPSMVLDFSHIDTYGHATSFLHTQQLGKISWINDIQREKDLLSAAKTLVKVADKEQQLWCKKIELSLGKLTLLAQGAGADPKSAEERSEAATFDAALGRVEQKLELVRVQSHVYQQLAPAFQDALDDEAAVELAMQAFAPNVPKKYNVLKDDLQGALRDLITRKVMKPLTLINLFTLLRGSDADVNETRLFCSAIRVADLSLHGEQKRQALRLIWRRCYIRDEWQKVNATENMNDRAVQKILSQTRAYSTMVACMTYHLNLTDSGATTEPTYILTPEETLGVFTNPKEEPFGTSKDAPALLEKRAEVMRWEDTTLKKYIEKNQLARWAQAAIEHADRTVRYDEDIAAKGAGFAIGNGNGNGKHTNGHVVDSVEDAREAEEEGMNDDADEIA